MKRQPKASGFTLVEFLITVVILVVLAMVLLPASPRGRSRAPRISCMNNLRQVGLAYRQWAIDHGDKYPIEVPATNGGAMETVIAGDAASVFRLLSNHLETPKIVFCPADKRRIRATTFATALTNGDRRSVPFLNNSNVSYFVGLDSSPTMPEVLLAGDDNWLMGGRPGYNGAGYNGLPVRPGLLLLGTNTLIGWSEQRHEKQGNAALSDGSVLGWSSAKLAEGLRHTGLATNRFVFP